MFDLQLEGTFLSAFVLECIFSRGLSHIMCSSPLVSEIPPFGQNDGTLWRGPMDGLGMEYWG